MSNRILKDIGWQARIRSELGVDEAYLSDAEIDRPEAITVAEANSIERVPSYHSDGRQAGMAGGGYRMRMRGAPV